MEAETQMKSAFIIFGRFHTCIAPFTQDILYIIYTHVNIGTYTCIYKPVCAHIHMCVWCFCSCCGESSDLTVEPEDCGLLWSEGLSSDLRVSLCRGTFSFIFIIIISCSVTETSCRSEKEQHHNQQLVCVQSDDQKHFHPEDLHELPLTVTGLIQQRELMRRIMMLPLYYTLLYPTVWHKNCRGNTGKNRYEFVCRCVCVCE